MNPNPWQAEGVSILPLRLKDLMPIVGQSELFESLREFHSSTLARGQEALSGFFVLIGGWGVGKSRVGHELCLEATAPEAQWIIEGKPERILREGLADGILPLFVRYSQVTIGAQGPALSMNNWIPAVTWEALRRLVESPGNGEANHLTKNQGRLMELTRQALGPKGRGWACAAPRLKAALALTPVDKAVREALDVLREDLQIGNIWIVVDEIEDITDIERDGLQSEDRGQGIDQSLMTVIPRVIKYEELRAEFPEISFVLLCSLTLGDLMRGIPSISRRTRWHVLTTNAFQDVEAFFHYLIANRPDVATSIAQYPPGLKEVAFFAANRNFGWFNVIMHYAHSHNRGGAVRVHDLMREFARNPPGGPKGTVFDLDCISAFHIPRDADYPRAERLIFGLLPQAIGPNADQIDDEVARRLLARTDGGTGRKLFTRIVEIEPPPPHLITAHLVSAGFRNTEGNYLVMPGEARFDIEVVVNGLRAYSIGLPEKEREKLLICEDETEFTEQIRSLSPYTSEAEQFAPPLHKFLILARARAKDRGESGADYIAPAFSFLRRFDRLNKTREAESGYLRDGRKNSQLEERYRNLSSDASKLDELFLRGVAFSWEKQLTTIDFVDKFNHVCAEFTSKHRPLTLGADAKVTLLALSSLDEHKLKEDLDRLARERRHPLLLMVKSNVELAERLGSRARRLAPDLAPFLMVHNVSQYQFEVLSRLGLMGDAFEASEILTNHFSGWVGTARQNLQQSVDTWQSTLDLQGFILRPIFHGRGARHEELRAIALGYKEMLRGLSYDQVLRSNALSQTDLDLFKKGVGRLLDPGPKYYEFPTLDLFVEESGVISVHVPRALIAFAQRCSALPMSKTALEESFLYETSDDTRPREIIQQIGLFLTYTDVLDASGEKFALVTSKFLKDAVDRAQDWLERDFEKAVVEVGAIHRDAGETLRDRYAKVARQELKDARLRLDSLDLAFVKSSWEELNRTGSDGESSYTSKWKAAVQVVSDVRTTVGRVFDSEASKVFKYTTDILPEFESQAGSDTFPLWKRVSILQETYRELRDRRYAMERRIEEVRADVQARVPEVSGERIFPIQAATLPLNFFAQEINFPSDRPNRTIQIGVTALGIQTVGFKVSAGKYREALDRLGQIQSELNDPSRLVSVFLEALREWEALRHEASSLAGRVAEAGRFFSDAEDATRSRFRLDALQEQMAELRGITDEGLMRQKTDQRETAGVSAFELAGKLAGDVQEVRALPVEVRALLDGIENSVIVRLQEDFREKHGRVLKAIQKIRLAQNEEPMMLPQKQASTWSGTVRLFDDVITQAWEEGQKYLPAVGAIDFEGFATLCEQQERLSQKNQDLDWAASPYREFVSYLMEKKLLRLNLIEVRA